MTADEHDIPETPVARETTELYPFTSRHPDRVWPGTGQPPSTHGPQPPASAVHGHDDPAIDLPVMEPLPNDGTLPDPGYPEMPAAPSVPHAPATSAQSYASGQVDLSPKPAMDPPETAQPGGAGQSDGPDGPDEPGSHPWPRAPRSSAITPTWQAAPYVEPRAPGAAPPLRGPAVPWSEVRSGADRPDSPEPLADPHADPHAQPHADPHADPHAGPGAEALAEPGAEPLPGPWAEPLPGPTAEPLAELPPELPPEPAVWPVSAPLNRPLSAPVPPSAAATIDDDPIEVGFAPLPDDPAPVRETAETLTSDLLLPGRRATPDPGWRRTVYRSTGGLIRIGESAATMRRHDRVSRIRTPVAGGHYRVAVLSLKGGVGKTTAAVGLGSTLASLRGDRVIAVDGNPDRGTLSDKVRLETPATIRDLLNERHFVTRYADVRAFTSQAPSRLEILASDRDPAVSVAFSADDYRAVAEVLEHYYSICITDCGTGLLHSAMAGILELADQIVLVSSPSVDGARSASATLDWLEAHGYGNLVGGGVVVLSSVRRKSKSAVDVDRLEQHFAGRCRDVVRIPFDAHLEEGAEVELELLSAETADAYLELAALVADGFAEPRGSFGGITPRFPLA
jgi:MinD-like ATPase involved in chromosome partitioning or flagellar assembly